MKNLFLAATVMLIAVACSKQQSGSPYQVAFYESNGNFRSPSNNWKIEISGKNEGLSVTRDVKDESIAGNFEGTSGAGPGDWTNKNGFFCAVDKSDRIWAFDGDSRIWILERFEDGTRTLSVAMAGGIPAEVESRLPHEIVKKYAEQAAPSNR